MPGHCVGSTHVTLEFFNHLFRPVAVSTTAIKHSFWMQIFWINQPTDTRPTPEDVVELGQAILFLVSNKSVSGHTFMYNAHMKLV